MKTESVIFLGIKIEDFPEIKKAIKNDKKNTLKKRICSHLNQIFHNGKEYVGIGIVISDIFEENPQEIDLNFLKESFSISETLLKLLKESDEVLFKDISINDFKLYHCLNHREEKYKFI